jgi:hypothetical protein
VTRRSLPDDFKFSASILKHCATLSMSACRLTALTCSRYFYSNYKYDVNI